jgi:acyl-coenzyme A synthetase/AMP-(fatty) acid ligase
VVACVVPAANATIGMLEVLTHFRATGVSPHKVPKRVVAVPSIPRTELGKVRRAELAAGVPIPDQ